MIDRAHAAALARNWDAFVRATLEGLGPEPEPPRCDHRWSPREWPAPPVCLRCHATPTASPSQLEHWLGCQHKWGLSRIRPSASTAAAEFGDRCHKIAEAYLTTGKYPDPATLEGRTVIAGLHLLPTPGSAAVECVGTMWVDRDGNVHPDAVTYVAGKVVGTHTSECALGLLFPNPVCRCGGLIGYSFRLDMLYGYVPGRHIVVSDHKTTGDMEHAKTIGELEDDPQRIIYAHWAATTWGVESVTVTWIYYQRETKHAKAKTEHVTFTESAARIAERFRALHPTVIDMVRARALPPDYLPKTLTYCGAFGRCSYRNECHANVDPLDLAEASLYTRTRRPRAERIQGNMSLPDLGSVVTAGTPAGITPPPGFAPPPSFAPAPVAAPAVPQLAPDVEAYIASLPAEQRDAARAYYTEEMRKSEAAAFAAAKAKTEAEAAATKAAAQGKPETTSKPAAPKKAGRPPIANAVKLLTACAEHGRTLEDTRAFLAELAKLEAVEEAPAS